MGATVCRRLGGHWQRQERSEVVERQESIARTKLKVNANKTDVMV